jgi:iron(III) transport system permease protein
MVALLVIVCFLVLLPLGMLIFGSFRTDAPYRPSAFTLQGYVQTFGDASTYQVLWTSLWLAVARTTGAVGIAVFLAWVIHRTDCPLRGALDKLLYFRFFIPHIPIILAWMLLGSKKGFLNLIATDVLGLSSGPFDVFSYWGIVITGILGWSSFLYVFISPAFRAMDASIEESARMSGATQRTTLLRITVPLLAPAILATTVLAFVRSIGSFESELFLGTPVGIYVLTTKMFVHLKYTPINYPAGMAMAMILLALTILLVVVQWRILGRRDYVTVTGRGYRPHPTQLGRFRWVVFALVVLFLVVDLVLPLAALILGSFMNVAGVVLPDNFTLKHYTQALGDRGFWELFNNTILVAGVAATVGMLLSALVAYSVVRTRYPGRRLLDLVSWLPWAIPGIVMGLGLLWAYVGLQSVLPIPLYGSIWLLVIAFITVGLPLGVRVMSSTIIQISSELEESGRTNGASWLQTVRYIWLPLLRPGLLAGWLTLLTLSVRDLSTIVLLYGPRSQVLSSRLFDWWQGGYLEEGVVLGLVQTVLVLIAFGLAQLATRAPRRQPG